MDRASFEETSQGQLPPADLSASDPISNSESTQNITQPPSEVEQSQKEESNSSESDIEFEEEIIIEDESVKSDKMSNMSAESDQLVISDDEEDRQGSQIDEKENVRMNYDDEEEFFQDREDEKKELKNKIGDKNISLRSFQATLFENSQERNSIIYLPTGTGKTRISICSMYYYLCKYGTSKKIVFLANTIQLVKQQAEAIKQTLTSIVQNKAFASDLRQRLGQNYIQLHWTERDINNQVICVHGEKSDDQTVTKRKRIEAYLSTKKEFINEMKKATVTVMISQMFLNCLRRGYIKLTDYSFIVFDQCHHCGGDHPYSGIMKEFYFEQKKKMRNDEKKNLLKEDEKLPVLMGLTASPVSQPFKDYKNLSKELKNLCINLDSNYAFYPHGQALTNQTQILIEKIVETEQSNRELVPDLIDYFDRHKDHKGSLDKIRTHFPAYQECVKKVIDAMSAKYECLKIDKEDTNINDPELYLLYDIKDCLLVKLRDLWLELGQFAFSLGFHQMVVELSRLTGLRNEENTKLLDQVKGILRKYDHDFRTKYGECKKEFMSAKLQRLIDILKPQSQEEKLQEKVTDMVLVFAFKRRTVKYLQAVLEKYRDSLPENEKKFYKSVGVTGYASTSKVYRSQDGYSFQSNPSAEEDQQSISKYYKTFEEREREQMNNRIHIQNSLLTENETLKNEMNRMFISKMGKMLLQVEEKYNNQIRKLIQFKKKEHRVLITTSVTEEGFDIPGCNLVISFDTPFSMKSYIQIKGRARKKNSKYIIFTFEKYYRKMAEDKMFYDNTITAIYELAINNISKENIDAIDKVKYSTSYEKVQTKGGALLNTNYALQLLKSYFSGLKQPNKPYFHYKETSNICFRCIIKFPESSTCSKTYVIGKPQPRKEEAAKSAAFMAVKILKKEGFIRDDLRPSRLQELEDELELQKYDDLGVYSKDKSYQEIFDRYVQIQEARDQQTQKKLIRFYFQSLESQKLQFPNLNRNFDHRKFESGISHNFQIYLVKFTNKSSNYLLSEDQQVNEVGILTCYQQEETEEIFAGFRQHLQPSCPQQIWLKLEEKSLPITKEEYEQYKKIHIFLLSSERNNEVDYYNYLNKEPPVIYPMWTHSKASKKSEYKVDENKKYHPVMVLMRKQKQLKSHHYVIDKQLNMKVMEHMDTFRHIYNFHNKPGRHVYQKPFERNLTNEYKLVSEILTNNMDNGKKRIHLVQCLDNQMCFHKGLLTSKVINYNRNIQVVEEGKKRNRMNAKYQRMKKQFMHYREEKDIYQQQVVKFEVWKKPAKEDLNQILNKQIKIKKMEDDKGIYRFLKDFVLFPVSYPTMLRISLISRYIFPTFQDFAVALYFRKFYLTQIFKQMKTKHQTCYRYSWYRSVLLDSSQKIFLHMQSAGKSRHLRDLGKILKANSALLPEMKNDISSIDMQNSVNQSASMEISFMNKSESSRILNRSLVDNSKVEEPSLAEIEEERDELSINMNVLNSLGIEDILRSLTSKIYKHQKVNNYEEFQFIGDVVLKYLATMQIFLENITCEEGQMHIARANLICNANLHRAAIRRKLFQYIFTTKIRGEPNPLVKVKTGSQTIKDRKNYGNTEIQLLDVEDEATGYQYIPGKIHADVMEALIGIFYLKNKNLNDCQTLLYAFGILSHPTLHIKFDQSKQQNYSLPHQLVDIENKLQYSFKHKEILVQALTHPSFMSYIEEAVEDEQASFSKVFGVKIGDKSGEGSIISEMSMMGDKTYDISGGIKKHQTFYERMEFLGDAFLDLVVVEYLYDQGGDFLDDEGTLSFLKQSAVSNKTLGFIALKQNLQEYLFIDVDELDETMREFRRISKEYDSLPSPLKFSKLKIGSLKVLGDIFESLIGAILIDNDFKYEETKFIVMNLIEKYIKHFTSMSFVQECPTFKYKEYLDQNNYKKYKLTKVLSEGILKGEYLYQLTDKTGNVIGEAIRASNDKDAWDVLLELKNQ